MPGALFNPNAKVQAVPIAGGRSCIVVDDALAQPEAWVRFAVAERPNFRNAPANAFPGVERLLPDEFDARLADVFRQHARSALGARRIAGLYSRMSMVTLPPQALQPAQWFCHRDDQATPAGHMIAACVLYLFHDEALGGTSFWVPRQDARATQALVLDTCRLSAGEFLRRHATWLGWPADRAPGYVLDSNAAFERVLVVPPRFNRLIFYDGGHYHSGHIAAPERLGDDPTTGRLTINGFITCTRQAA